MGESEGPSALEHLRIPTTAAQLGAVWLKWREDGPPRGIFYPCERAVLEGYVRYVQHPLPDTLGYNVDTCDFYY